MYQPLPVTTFALNFHFSGLDPFPLHLINLMFHLLNIVLVYKWVQLLTANHSISLVVALLFAIHPMNVEAVTWISARSSSMYTAFYLSALIFYTTYLKTNDIKNLLLTGLMFLLALFNNTKSYFRKNTFFRDECCFWFGNSDERRNNSKPHKGDDDYL
ncbi:MAG: glycosyltransferase family 39 protein [Bacteroidetes bacterium]|nr:glycosyltransferase family 39 protein [Bacteroidota bacterium]